MRIRKGNVNQTLDQKLGNLIDRAEGIVSVFTGMVQDLRSTNEELAVVAIEAEKVAQTHANMADNAKAKILANQNTISKIESIIG